jgi:hypothetical protein
LGIKVRFDPNYLQKMELPKRSLRRIIFASHVDLDTTLREGNPFDTGFSASSWFPQIDGAPSENPNPPPPGGTGSRGASDPAVLLASIGHVLTLANSAPYIGRLADGYSPQAPAGWIEAVALMYQDFVEKHAMAERAKLK